MSADQLRRAADVAIGSGYNRHHDHAVAALLRAAADDAGDPRLDYDAQLDHTPWRTGCRVDLTSEWEGGPMPGSCLACLLDDVAAAYLGEEPQP